MGRCIYCGRDATEVLLGDEHIIPLSLGGPLVLPQSSCPECARKTAAFELVCGRTMFGPYRLAGDLPTRCALAEYPVLSFALPELGPAGLLTGAPSTEVFDADVKIINLVRDSEAHQAAEAAGNRFEVPCELRMTEFARLLAKIAHAFAVAELGSGAFRSFLPPFILGEAPNLPDLVGGIAELEPSRGPFVGPVESRVTGLIQHHLDYQIVRANDGTTYLTVLIRLLQFIAPPYCVVVARIDGPSAGDAKSAGRRRTH